MKVSINPLRHIILGRKFLEKLPEVKCFQTSTIEGYIDIAISTLKEVEVSKVGIYLVQAPTDYDFRYIRINPSENIYGTTPTCLAYNVSRRNNRHSLFWRFYPGVISGVEAGKIYSLEFNIEDSASENTATTANILGAVIVNIVESMS